MRAFTTTRFPTLIATALRLGAASFVGCCDGDPTVSAAPADTSKSPASLEVSASSLQRGSFMPLAFTRTAAAPPFDAVDAAAIAIRATAGLTFSITGASPDRIDTLVAVDASAPLGKASVEIVAGGTTHSASQAITIADADTAPTFVGPITEVKLGGEKPSALLWIDPLAPLAFVEIALTSPRPTTGMLALEADGRFPKDLSFRTESIRGIVGASRGLVVHDTSNDAATITLSMRRRPIREATDVVKQTAIAVATALGAPDVYVARATLAAGEAQFYSVDVGPGGVGQRLHVETLAGDAATDTKLAVFRDDQVTMLGGPSSDRELHDQLLSPTISAAGRYYIRVEPGSAFDPAHADYSFLVTFE